MIPSIMKKPTTSEPISTYWRYAKHLAGATGINPQIAWEEIVNTVWEKKRSAADAAIVRFAQYVHRQEQVIPDLIAMADQEKAQRLHRRLIELTQLLNDLAAWWEAEKELWDSVIAHQRAQEDKLNMLTDMVNVLAYERHQFMADALSFRALYESTAKAEALFLDILTRGYEKCK
jgi:hypothetical protein